MFGVLRHNSVLLRRRLRNCLCWQDRRQSIRGLNTRFVELAGSVACLRASVGPVVMFIQRRKQRAEQGVKALEGADGDAANAIELVRGEVLSVDHSPAGS